MLESEAVTSQTVDLTNCDKELIHIPGAIQPHGILFVLKEPQLKILQVSNNTYDILGYHPQDLLKKTLKDLLDSEQVNSIQKCLSEDFECINPLKISVKNQDQTLIFDGIIHRSNEFIILELEPTKTKVNADFFSFYHLVKGSISKMQNASGLHELCQIIVKEVRKLTGFDRVMLYKFEPEGVGAVIAEDTLDSSIPYLNLRYPASDIPKQARQLYILNSLRIIPEVNYQPTEILPIHNPITNSPLDLSYSVLRSVSPIHIEYLKNMGAAASMSISLIREKKLWGLIACHHHSVKYVNYEVRTVCEFLGQVMSLEITAKEDNEDLDRKVKLKSIQSKFVESIPQAENFVDGLVKPESNLLDLVDAQGAAVYLNDQIIVIGKTPQEADIQDLIDWVETKIQNDVFYTDSLPKIYPLAEKFKDIASGLLALSISKIQKNYICGSVLK
jgi:light-regulated signal transduction histidine kinase (bacteriophytochrome)